MFSCSLFWIGGLDWKHETIIRRVFYILHIFMHYGTRVKKSSSKNKERIKIGLWCTVFISTFEGRSWTPNFSAKQISSKNSRSTSCSKVQCRRKSQQESPLVTAKDLYLFWAWLQSTVKFGTQECLINDFMGLLIQGPRQVYRETGHRNTWSLSDAGNAQGNLSINNPGFESTKKRS